LKQLALSSTNLFTAQGDYFQALTPIFEFDTKKDVWEEIFLKGVNIGAALPGKFPAEFSLTFDEYLDWFTKIGQMNSNVIRTYTILPPEFYDAFAYYNLHNQNNKLFLLQGVWAKIPSDDNYYNPTYNREFKKEIIDVVNLIHGKALINPKPGHASGIYVSDISKYVIGILLGREWEPQAVVKTNHNNKENHFNGHFIHMNEGNAMEVWLAKIMEYCIHYETQTYSSQRPVSFVNWLPLDPMHHVSEFIESDKVREFDNDLESIDFCKFHSTELFHPGLFASYHAYPYYPDFIYMQKEYATAVNNDGQTDNYFGYLLDLKKRHPGMPLVIAEYGLPNSRGNSHQTPLGFDQGGLSEYEQAKLGLQLTKDIADSRCAGAIYFEWIDEWFKHNWLVMDFEQPNENRKQWHNMENTEQNFGVYAYESKTKIIDGKFDDWPKNKIAAKKFSMQADADETYFYLAIHIPDLDFSTQNVYLAIDVFDKAKGDHKLPFLENELDHGIEFLLQIKDTNHAKILVDDQFSIYNDFQNDIVPVFSSKENYNGIFIDQTMLSNRGKTTIFDSIIEPYVQNRSILTHGNSSNPKSSNADWHYNPETNSFEIRLAWHLLNVSDPSGNYVLDDKDKTGGIEYAKTDGFTIYGYLTDQNDKLVKTLTKNKAFTYNWEGWEIPNYTKRLKPIYYLLKEYFAVLNPKAAENVSEQLEESFRITDFYNNKVGAISLLFNDAGFTQITEALPIVSKYYFQISFGIRETNWNQNISNFADEGSFSIKRFGISEIKDLISYKHEVSMFFPSATERNSFSNIQIDRLKFDLEQQTRRKVRSYYFQHGNQVEAHHDLPFGVKLNAINQNNIVSKTDFQNLKAYRMTHQFPKQFELDSIIKSGAGSWMIFSYYHFFKKDSKEYRFIESGKYANTYSVSPYIFERQARLFRNSDYWMATVSNVGKYLTEKKYSTITSSSYGNMVFLTLVNQLDKQVYNQPLTIEITSAAQRLKVTGSMNDGIFQNRNGKIYIHVKPNQEVKIEKLYN
jgi:hypothetical protein